MRKILKIKTKEEKKIEKKLKQTPNITNEKVKEKLQFSKYIMLLTFFNGEIKKVFRYKNINLGNYRKEIKEPLELQNTVFTVDCFKTEIILFASIWNALCTQEELNFEKGTVIIGISRNTSLKKLVEKEIKIVKAKYELFLAEYIQDIKDRDLQIHIFKFLILTAICELARKYIEEVPREELLKFHTSKEVRNLKTILTKFINRIPYILKIITGRKNVTEFKVKSVLEMFGDTKYNIKVSEKVQ